MASPSEQPRALVTGLNGFTGRYVADELVKAGYEVFGTVHRAAELHENTYSVDICDRHAIAAVVNEVQPDVVIHLAAISFVAHGDAEAIYRVNVSGTRNILEALSALSKKPTAVLIASSANIYGNSDAGLIDELVPASPANDYAVSKLAMEYMAKLWMDKLPIVITRPFNYTGVGQGERFLIPKIVEHFKRSEPIIELGNIDVERDFSDVRMVAKYYVDLLRNIPSGEVVNVCSGAAFTLRSVLDTMSDIAGYQIEIKINPAFVRANEVKVLRGNPAKLHRLSFKSEPAPFIDTLRWMYETK